MAMQDVYDFFFDVNTHLIAKGLDRLDDMLRPVGRRPMTFTEVYLGQVSVDDFRRNPRGELGTRTATLHAAGIAKLRHNWIYRLEEPKKMRQTRSRGALDERTGVHAASVDVYGKLSKLRYCSHSHCEVLRVLLQADALVTYGLSSRERGARSSEWVQHRAFAERQCPTH